MNRKSVIPFCSVFVLLFSLCFLTACGKPAEEPAGPQTPAVTDSALAGSTVVTATPTPYTDPSSAGIVITDGVFPDLSAYGNEAMTGISYQTASDNMISVYKSTLPVVYINSDSLIGDEAVTASMFIQSDTTEAAGLYDGNIEIKLRGNSTRYRLKAPYKIKLETGTDLFGMGKSKHWVLLANDIDHTLIRNKLVCDLAASIGMEYSTESVLVSLVLNGNYMGVYQLCEHIRVDEERVDISDNGFLLEMDFYAFGDHSLSRLITAFCQPWYFNTPETVETTSELYKTASEFIQSLEYALHSPDHIYHADDTHYSGEGSYYDWNLGEWVGTVSEAEFTATTYDGQHYSQMIDMDSLLQNFIICEFTMNWDCMKNSVFLYKDEGEPARIGPVWDFDWSFGNINMYNIYTDIRDDWQTTNNYFTNEQYYQSVQWNRYLIRDPYFVMKLYEFYQEIRPREIEDAIASVDTYREYLAEAGAANDGKWRATYTNRRYYAGRNSQNFTKSFESLKSFISDRMEWLDAQFTDFETLLSSLGYYTQCREQLYVESESTADNRTILNVAVTDASISSVVFQVNGTHLMTAPVTEGRAQTTISDGLLTEGMNMVQIYGTDADGNYLKVSEEPESAPVSNYYILTK